MQRRTEIKTVRLFIIQKLELINMYKVCELSKKYGDLEVLKNISVDIKEGGSSMHYWTIRFWEKYIFKMFKFI